MFSPTLTTEVTSAPLYQVSVVWGVGELFEKPMPSRWFNPNWCYGVLLVAAVVGFYSYMLLSHWPPSRASSLGLSAVAAGWPPLVRDHFLILFFLCGASPNVATELLQKGIVLALMGWISADFWLFVLRTNAMVTTHFVLSRTVAEQVNPGSWTCDWAIDWLFPFSPHPKCMWLCRLCCMFNVFFVITALPTLHAVLPAGMLQVARRRNQFLVLQMARFRFLATRHWQGRGRGPAENLPIFGFFGLLTWETKVISDKAHICRPLSDVVHTTEQS